MLVMSGCNSQRNNVSRQSIENRLDHIKPIEFKQSSRNEIKTKGSMEEFNRSNPYNIPEQVDRTDNDSLESEYNTERANHIAKVITNLPEVKKSTVIITGNTALVGVVLASNIAEEEVDETKKTIEEKTFSADASLKNVSITASPEIVKRITNISEDLSQGKPITGLAEELGSIIRRITPTI